MRPAIDYRWLLAGALFAGLMMFGLWRAVYPTAPGPVTRTPPITVVPDGRSASANGTARTHPGTAVPPGEEARVRSALDRDPLDIDAHLDLARVHLARREMGAVWDETRYVLARSPGEPRALTYQAMVRFSAGETDRAVTMLERVVAAAPELDEARRSLVYAYRRTGREDDAATVAAGAPRAARANRP
jgi:tetratricopeptide (TPR) repeat protein